MKNLTASSISILLMTANPSYSYDVLHSLTPIINLYQRNEVAAFDRFNGNYYQINGNVREINSRDRLVVIQSGRGILNCFYSPRDHGNVVDLRRGGQISVKGPLRITKNYRNLVFSINKCRVVGSHHTDKQGLSKKQQELLRLNRIMNSDW